MMRGQREKTKTGPRSVANSTRRLLASLLLFLVITAEVCLFAHWRTAIPHERARPGERYITDEAFLTCVQARLDGEGPRIPFVIIPVTLEYLDFKTYLCTLDVPIQHLMVIISGDFDPFLALGHVMKKRFDASGRVLIRLHPENPGYSACMNEGLRAALQHPLEEVPWVLLTNSDVRYAPGFWSDFMKTISSRIQYDAARIRSLRSEKDQELHSRWPVGYEDGSRVVASNLLPDRIRSMSVVEMSAVFANHVGLFYGAAEEDMCSFVRTRLHIETVGYFDENYYPLYGEDHDLQWRSRALGFSSVISPPGNLVHFSRANVEAVKEDTNGRVVVQSPEAAKTWRSIKRMSQQGIRWRYRHLKWFPISTPLGDTRDRFLLPFNGSIPPDVWVRDDSRIERIKELATGKRINYVYLNYNKSLLAAGAP